MKKSVFSSISLLFLLTLSPWVVAQGDATAGGAKVALCASCHGAGGRSQIAANPNLAGQNASYLVKQLQEFKAGTRQDPIMAPMALGLSEQDMEDIAAYYAAQDPVITGAQPGEEVLALGEKLYRAGNQEIESAACTACHSPTGNGNAPAGFPALSGQHAEYTLKQLRAFRSGARNNDLNGMMRTVVERLTDAELEALANYAAGLN